MNLFKSCIYLTFILQTIDSTGNYNVWETDYKSYALVYSCNELGSVYTAPIFKEEYAWILSRTGSLDTSLVQRLKDKLKASGVKSDKLSSVKQNCN